jgi:hypothetical protein
LRRVAIRVAHVLTLRTAPNTVAVGSFRMKFERRVLSVSGKDELLANDDHRG